MFGNARNSLGILRNILPGLIRKTQYVGEHRNFRIPLNVNGNTYRKSDTLNFREYRRSPENFPFTKQMLSFQVFYLLSVFQKYKGWHGRDIVFLGDVLSLVNIDFEENHVGHFSGHCLDFWGNHFARSTPGGEKVNDNQFA